MMVAKECKVMYIINSKQSLNQQTSTFPKFTIKKLPVVLCFQLGNHIMWLEILLTFIILCLGPCIKILIPVLFIFLTSWWYFS